MQIGELVRHKRRKNLLGYVTNTRQDWFENEWAVVYWFVIEAKSPWINTDNLEVLDESR